MTSRYLLGSALWGVIWGGIAFLMGFQIVPRESLLIGVLASPVIGTMMGILSSPMYSLHFLLRLILLPVLVYASAFLFALAMSMRDPVEQNVGGVLAGTTYYIFILVPVAFFTHFSLGYLRKPPVRAYRE